MADDVLGKVISLFSGDKTEHMSDKEIVLRQRHKELGENKYAKFFRQKTDEADVSLAQFFHTLYKMIMPIRGFMKDVTKMTQLRQVVMEAFIDPSIVETIRRLSPQAIEERAKATPSTELVAEIRGDISKLASGFNSTRINGVNRCHNMIMVISQLVNFDYPGIIKKFDPNFTEGPFSDAPKFVPVKVEAVFKEISEFLMISQGIVPESDWKTLLKLLKICAKEELISETQFAQMLIGLRDILNSKILLLLVQYASKNPVWTCKPQIPDEHVAEAWMEAKTLKAQACIDKIHKQEKMQKIDVLAREIFDSEELIRLEYYTPEMSAKYQKRELSGFTHADAVNYLACFMKDCFEREIHDLCDIVLIRGQWTNNAASKEMSESLHQVMGLQESITQLDESLSVDGADGSRLKAAMVRADRDQTQIRYINGIIETVNDTALELLNHATLHFAIIGKHLKNMGEDAQKKHPELLVNWRELSSVSKDHPLAPQMVKCYEKIHGFVELMLLGGAQYQ
ncbi:MAG: DUF5312 family protein [Treponema sp.]|nr:DUF5312 family protein [Treponema sp.]